MSKSFKILLVLLGLCLALAPMALGSQPKFHFRDCVKVTKGFYSTCQGRITSMLSDQEEEYCSDGNNKHIVVSKFKYQVEGDCKGGNFMSTLEEAELSLVKGKCEGN